MHKFWLGKFDIQQKTTVLKGIADVSNEFVQTLLPKLLLKT